MHNKRPEFPFTEHTVQSLITELHSYFRDLQSYYNIRKGALLSQMETVTDPQITQEIREKLADIDQKMLYFHILNNSISTVDSVIHTPQMNAEFHPPKE